MPDPVAVLLLLLLAALLAPPQLGREADPGVHFMLSLYRSAAGPGGAPKQQRKFGANTVRLLRPHASSPRSLPASGEHQYSFSVHYRVDLDPSEELIRASLVHLRAPSAPGASSPHPRCRARVAWPGRGSPPVVMEPQQRWAEAHAGPRRLGSRLSLIARYRCAGPAPEGRPPRLEAPSLLLYLEERRRRGGSAWRPSTLPTRRRRSSEGSPASVLADVPAAGRGKSGAVKNRCKLHSFRLSFDELDWGHFIAPPVYNPRFCQGDCPRVLTYGYHSPNHAIVQSIIRELGVADVPPPSCVPYKYMPMSVLVEHKNKVEYKELEDMVAESCTCR